MADSVSVRRTSPAESLQIFGGDPIVGVGAKRTIETARSVGGFAQPGQSNAKIRPGRCVPRFQLDSATELAFGAFGPIGAQQERAVVESNACDARASVDGILEHHLCAIDLSSVPKPHGQVVDVIGDELVRAHRRVVGAIRAA